MTNRERIMAAIKGEMPDRLPFAPRLDLWFSSNVQSGTLPKGYENFTADEIARKEGWALHKINPEYQMARRPEDNLHWGLGILSYKESVYQYQFSSDIEIEVKKENERIKIRYRTPVGSVSTTVLYSDEMKKGGVSAFWIEEHAIKTVKDYEPIGYIFERVKLLPDARDFVKWQEKIGQDGVAFTLGGRAASPIHHIQKYFFDDTTFFYHYIDYQKEMQKLAERMVNYFNQVIELVSQSPADVVYWGANFDEMITYPPFFKKEIIPWIRKAAARMQEVGKFVSCHCDGENRGLLDLIRDSGMHVAEAVCPAPMTKVPIEEYYRRWSDKLTIFGGIPSILLLKETSTEEEFESYLENLFQAVHPGKRMILGISDSTPPKADFRRLKRIGEAVEEKGWLPLKAGSFRPVMRAGQKEKISEEGKENLQD